MVGFAWFRSTTASMQLASGYACSTQKALRGGQAEPSASYANIALFEGSCNQHASSFNEASHKIQQGFQVATSLVILWILARSVTPGTDRTCGRGEKTG